MEVKVLLILAIIATSSLIYAGQVPAVHIWYETNGQKATQFAVQLSGEVLVDNTYWEAIGFSGGYCGMQSGLGTERKMLFSMWNTPYGNAEAIQVSPMVKLNPFGGEGNGVQTIVTSSDQSPGAAQFATWYPTYQYTFHIQSKRYGSNGTEITLYVYKPEYEKWFFFSSLVKYHAANDPEIGYMSGFGSFLEDFSGNRLQRTGKIHGAWFKTEYGGAWQTVDNVSTDHGAEPVGANEYAQPENQFGPTWQELRYSTGGNVNDGHQNVMYTGPITFKPPVPELDSVPVLPQAYTRFLSQ